MSLHPRCVTLFPLVLMLACSSNDRSTAPAVPEGQPFAAGPLVGLTDGPVGRPVTTSGSGALITGIPGQFTSLRYRSPGGDNASSYIYFTMRDSSEQAGYSHIWRIGSNGTGLRRLTSDTLYQVSPSVSPDGSLVVYSQWDGEPGRENTENIWRMGSDGSGKAVIGFKFATFDNFSWRSDGQLIYYATDDDEDGSAGISGVSPIPGRPGEVLTSATVDFSPSYGVINGVPSVLFSRHDAIWQFNLVTRDTLIYLADSTHRFFRPLLSPDSRRLLFLRQRPGDPGPALVVTMTAAPRADESELLTLTTGQFTGAAWEPDGKHIVVGMSLSGEAPQLYEMNPDSLRIAGGGVMRLVTHLTGVLLSGMSIGPAAAAQSRQLIGPSAALGETASGIVFGQGTGGALASVVAFRAATPDSVALSAETGLNSTSPVLSVSLRTDRLSSLAFTNDPLGSATLVVDSGSAANGALITFDATSGAVALVLPYALAPGETTPTIRDNGATRVFRGHFLGVYGADGIDRSRSPVTQVELTPRGDVIRFSR